MNNKMDFLSKLSRVDRLSALPDLVAKLVSMLDSPDVSGRDLSEAISHDVAISTRLLKIVNSPFYGFNGSIKNISHAIVVLGFNTVKGIILSFSAVDLIKALQDTEFFSKREFWRHCVGCGIASREIAKLIGIADDERFFTAGLLHDVGKMIMWNLAPEEFLGLVKYAKDNNLYFYEAEYEREVVHHTEIAKKLFRRWNMPGSLVEVVSLHHEPEKAEFIEDVRIIRLADQMARNMQIGDPGDNKCPDEGALEYEILGMSLEQLQGIMPIIYQRLDDAQAILNII